jgi:hypothetical protein
VTVDEKVPQFRPTTLAEVERLAAEGATFGAAPAEPFTVSVDADTFDRVGAMLAANRIANLLRKPDARTPSEARAQEKAVAKRRAKAKAARKARARNRK